jgi:hypothetical protein
VSKMVMVVLSSASDSFFPVSRRDSNMKKELFGALNRLFCGAGSITLCIRGSNSILNSKICSPKLKVLGDILSP